MVRDFAVQMAVLLLMGCYIVWYWLMDDGCD